MNFFRFQRSALLLLIVPGISCMEPEMLAEPVSNNLMALCTQLHTVQDGQEKTMLYKKFAQSYIENPSFFSKHTLSQCDSIRELITQDTMWLDQLSDNILLTPIDCKRLACSQKHIIYEIHFVSTYPKEPEIMWTHEKSENASQVRFDRSYYVGIPCEQYILNNNLYGYELFEFKIIQDAINFPCREEYSDEFYNIINMSSQLRPNSTRCIKHSDLNFEKIMNNLGSYQLAYCARNREHIFSFGKELVTSESGDALLSLYSVRKMNNFCTFVQKEATLEQLACITALIFDYKKNMLQIQTTPHAARAYTSLALSKYFLQLQPNKEILEPQPLNTDASDFYSSQGICLIQ